MTEIVLGKFLGLFAFVVILVALLMLMPLSLYVGTTLDAGKLFSIFLSMLLLLAAFAAIGSIFIQPHRKPDHCCSQYLRCSTHAVDD